MTHNLYAGFDGPRASAEIGAALRAGHPEQVPAIVGQAWAAVESTDFHTRALALADEIEAQLPDLIGLQEALLYRSGPHELAPATHTELDFLQVLLDELAKRDRPYRVVASVDALDLEFPRLRVTPQGPALDDLRMTDRDALLVRADLPIWDVQLWNAHCATYAAKFVDLNTGATTPAGYCSVEGNVRGQVLRFVTTHLDPSDPAVQLAQARELIRAESDSLLPVIMVGDFNAPALPSNATYKELQNAGFQDGWSETRGSEPGFTALFDAALRSDQAQLTSRIDLVLYRNPAFIPVNRIRVSSTELLGEALSDRVAGLRPSDHAGVAATVTGIP